MNEPSEFKIALAAGPDGAFVDVSDYVLFNDGGIVRAPRRVTGFVESRPSTFEFTLDNSDGRFTPNSPTSALDTPVVEGMRVCWQLNDRLVSGRIRRVTPMFADVSNAETSRVRIVADDALGVLARTELINLDDQLVSASGMLGLWKFDEPAGSLVAEDSSPNLLPPFQRFTAAPTFGAEPLPWSSETQAQGGGAPSTSDLFRAIGISRDFGYPAGSAGSYGFWFTLITPNTDSQVYFQVYVALAGGNAFFIEAVDSQLRMEVATGGGAAFAYNLTAGAPIYVNVDLDVVGADLRARMYIDGNLVLTRTNALIAGSSSADLSPIAIGISLKNASGDPTEYRFSRLSHTFSPVPAYAFATTSTTAEYFNLLADALPSVSFAEPPASLSGALIQIHPERTNGESALSVLNDLVSTEQGYLYTETTGTLLDPVEAVVIRERTRSEVDDATFGVTTDVLGAPSFARDLTDALSEVTVQTPNSSFSVDSTATQAVIGSARRSESVLLTGQFAAIAWGEDRLIRGLPDSITIASFQIDARGTDTDRWDDILGLREGDRVSVSGLPESQLGTSEISGWIVGIAERHDAERNLFTFYLQPAIENIGRFDEALFQADGNLVLGGAIDASVTQLQAITTTAALTETNLPVTLLIDDEQMTATEVRSGVNRTNWAQIPSIETGVGIAPIQPAGTMIAGSTLSIASGTGAFGTKYARLTITTPPAVAEGANIFRGRDSGTPSNRIPVTPGEPVSVSFWVRSNIAQRVRPGLQWITSGGTSAGFDAGSDYTLPANNWTEIVMEGYTAPAATATLRVQLDYGASPIAWATSDVLDADGFLIEKAASLGTYFDGSTSATSQFTYAWTGAVEESTSTETIVGQFVTVTRAANDTTAASHAEDTRIDILPRSNWAF